MTGFNNVKNKDNVIIQEYLSNIEKNIFFFEETIDSINIKEIVFNLISIVTLLVFEYKLLYMSNFYLLIIINIVVSILASLFIKKITQSKLLNRRKLYIFSDWILIQEKGDIYLVSPDELKEVGIKISIKDYPKIMFPYKNKYFEFIFSNRDVLEKAIEQFKKRKQIQGINKEILDMLLTTEKNTAFKVFYKYSFTIILIIFAIAYSYTIMPIAIDISNYKKTLLTESIKEKRKYLDVQSNSIFREYVLNDIDNQINKKMLEYISSVNKSVLNKQFISLLGNMRRKSDYRLSLKINVDYRYIDKNYGDNTVNYLEMLQKKEVVNKMNHLVDNFKSSIRTAFGDEIFEITNTNQDSIPKIEFLCKITNSDSYYYSETEKQLPVDKKRKYPNIQIEFYVLMYDENSKKIASSRFYVEPKSSFYSIEDINEIYNNIFKLSLADFEKEVNLKFWAIKKIEKKKDYI